MPFASDGRRRSATMIHDQAQDRRGSLRRRRHHRRPGRARRPGSGSWRRCCPRRPDSAPGTMPEGPLRHIPSQRPNLPQACPSRTQPSGPRRRPRFRVSPWPIPTSMRWPGFRKRRCTVIDRACSRGTDESITTRRNWPPGRAGSSRRSSLPNVPGAGPRKAALRAYLERIVMKFLAFAKARKCRPRGQLRSTSWRPSITSPRPNAGSATAGSATLLPTRGWERREVESLMIPGRGMGSGGMPGGPMGGAPLPKSMVTLNVSAPGRRKAESTPSMAKLEEPI